MKHATTGWVFAMIIVSAVGTPAQAVLPPGAVLTERIAEFDFPVTQDQARDAVSAGLVEKVYVPDETSFNPAFPTLFAGFHIINILDANHLGKTGPFKSISLAAHANGVIAVTFKSTGMTVFAKTAVTPAGGGKSDIAITGFSRHIIKTAVDGVADATTSLGAIAFKEIDGRTYLLGGSDGGGSEQTPGKIRVFVPDPIAPNVVYKVDVHDIVHGSFAGDGGFGSDLTAEFVFGDPNTFVAPTTAVGVEELFPGSGIFTKFEVSEGVTDGLAVFGDEIWLSDENNRRNIFVKKGGVIYTIHLESLITAFDTNDNEPDPNPFDGAFADQKFHGVSGLLLSFDGEFIRLSRPRQGKVNLGKVIRGNEQDMGIDINGDGMIEDVFAIGIVPTVGKQNDTIWTTADPSAERDEQLACLGDILLVRDAGSATILGYDSHGFCVIPAPPPEDAPCKGLTPGYWKNWRNHYTDAEFTSLLPGTIAADIAEADAIFDHWNARDRSGLRILQAFVLANQLTLNLTRTALPNPSEASLFDDCLVAGNEEFGTLDEALVDAVAILDGAFASRKTVLVLKSLLDAFANQ